MLSRTRVDVDALNLRARAAAVAVGEVTGPVTKAGGRDWQAGDVLRARRNDRRLKVGDGHVRNGDRYQVLGPGPEDGLIVQDLSGRGRVVLPAAYLAEHAEYGWASTIDAAQGATADVGLVLVRAGLDREHLYVALTRGGMHRDGASDLQVPHLKMLLGFLGMTDVTLIYSEGLGMGPEAVAKAQADANEEVAALLA